jgi:hypothetical protein
VPEPLPVISFVSFRVLRAQSSSRVPFVSFAVFVPEALSVFSFVPFAVFVPKALDWIGDRSVQ